MKKKKWFLSPLLLFAAISLQAQSSPFHYFDHKNLTVIQGQVLRIDYEEVYGKKTEFLMLHIQSEDQRLFRVEVCPQWFMEADLAVGMKIRIYGSRLQTADGSRYLIAQELSIQGERISLRDSKGFPLWSRQGQSGGLGKHRGPRGRGKR